MEPNNSSTVELSIHQNFYGFHRSSILLSSVPKSGQTVIYVEVKTNLWDLKQKFLTPYFALMLINNLQIWSSLVLTYHMMATCFLQASQHNFSNCCSYHITEQLNTWKKALTLQHTWTCSVSVAVTDSGKSKLSVPPKTARPILLSWTPDHTDGCGNVGIRTLI